MNTAVHESCHEKMHDLQLIHPADIPADASIKTIQQCDAQSLLTLLAKQPEC